MISLTLQRTLKRNKEAFVHQEIPALTVKARDCADEIGHRGHTIKSETGNNNDLESFLMRQVTVGGVILDETGHSGWSHS